ncbi:MAG: DEAD/DEAH box helicase [Verrucomicrobia bacterium]|nr:DEAD/DEAH box helicase [Verrucomicrobiota bacterium]
MGRVARKNGQISRSGATKYDAHHKVLNKTYGVLADLRRELADSKTAVAERTEILLSFAHCTDSQRAWLLLEDYFEKLALARKDFPGQNWWPRLLNTHGKERLEETAQLFFRENRPIPTELSQHANMERFAATEQAEKDQELVGFLENWLLPATPVHLDSPRATLRVRCELELVPDDPVLHSLKVRFGLIRQRTGEKTRSLAEITELTARSAHEEEQFSAADWDFIVWLTETYPNPVRGQEFVSLTGIELLQWLARWGQTSRLELSGQKALSFHGQFAELDPHLETIDGDLSFSHRLKLPHGEIRGFDQVSAFFGRPSLVLVDSTFFLLHRAPPGNFLSAWISRPYLPVKRLSHRLLTSLRKIGDKADSRWADLCVTHPATPQFVFELADETVRLRLLARSNLDGSLWQWNGHEWQSEDSRGARNGKPQILDDPQLEPATYWLRRLDWFTPEPGVWVGDANEDFLGTLAAAWPDRPPGAEYLGDPAFQRLFLVSKPLRPRLEVKGTGIDWFSVSASWEAEGVKLTPADLRRLQTATGRFVKLPDSGWMELDSEVVRAAHETIAGLGLEHLSATPQRVPIAQAVGLEESTLGQFQESPTSKALRQRISDFEGVPEKPIPSSVRAELRPYQKAGFHFLCHLAHLGLGGVLADDMGLGKTLQTLTWLAWLGEKHSQDRKPSLVICPASVLHNWRREANRFTPHLRVLLLESGAARHNLRKQIPQHDLIITNYALLRRDLTALQKFEFRSIILDEAQFIKNPSAQVTQSVKQLRADHRVALTGTPLENRLLDLWSIVDFVQPAYLGTTDAFQKNYEPKGDDNVWAQKVGRRRLSAKLRPLMLRRLKRQVAEDLPDRIEERRDCELHTEQRKLYLAELRRSREKVLQTIQEKGLAQSKIHVLAALTRLRQICCHPQLVGNDSASGKTDTLFELLEPLIAEGQKVLVFSQFVKMLKLLQTECAQREFPTYLLAGETKNRHDVVQAFQTDPKASVFLLSLRAAGTGLNLTTASYVVLYDPWWNPAVEAQAIDRSHRIGQTNTVNAYRLIAPGTVEEKIWELQQRKAQTIVDVLGEEGFARNLSKTDLEYLFSEE